MNEDPITLDVRTEIRAGVEPLSKILKTVGGLRDLECLRLIAPFKPVPLFALLAKKGFGHREQPLGNGDWEVIFSRSACLDSSAKSFPTDAPSGGPSLDEPVVVDARGLEPPQPLVTILEALTQLPAGARMRALTDRRPMHLYAQLTDRGFVGESEEQPDGSFITHIRRA